MKKEIQINDLEKIKTELNWINEPDCAWHSQDSTRCTLVLLFDCCCLLMLINDATSTKNLHKKIYSKLISDKNPICECGKKTSPISDKSNENDEWLESMAEAAHKAFRWSLQLNSKKCFRKSWDFVAIREQTRLLNVFIYSWFPSAEIKAKIELGETKTTTKPRKKEGSKQTERKSHSRQWFTMKLVVVFKFPTKPSKQQTKSAHWVVTSDLFPSQVSSRVFRLHSWNYLEIELSFDFPCFHFFQFDDRWLISSKNRFIAGDFSSCLTRSA